MLMHKEDFLGVIELPSMANGGGKTLTLIRFAEWYVVYLLGHVRCTIEHDIESNLLRVTAPYKGIQTSKIVKSPKEAIATIIKMVCAK